MAPELTLGPLLRYAGETDATIWVETDGAGGLRSRVWAALDGLLGYVPVAAFAALIAPALWDRISRVVGTLRVATSRYITV